MDGIGTLDLAWAQGYDGSQADYITRDVICFKCGNKIKFVGEDGQESCFPAPPEGLGVVSVQGQGHLFAFSDQVINPTIYVYTYPSFRLVSELKDGAQLEYTKIVFSSSEFLATLSGVPDFQLTLWNFQTGEKLATHDFGEVIPTCMTFDPANWRQMFITTKKDMTMWQIERSNNLYILHRQKIRLPTADGSGLEPERDIPTRASTRMSRVTVQLPQTSVAGVMGEEAERFDEYRDQKERVSPTTHVWTPSGDIIMGCAEGQLIKIDGESYHLSMLYNPGPRATSAASRMSQSFIREQSELEAADSSTSLGYSNVLTAGSLDCLVLHKKGLFVGGQDGSVRHLEVQPQQVRVIETFPVGVPISSLGFNPAHHKLAVGSTRGSIHIYDPSDPGSGKELFDIHDGSFVGLDTLSPGTEHCVSIREDGELQVWRIDNAKLVGSLSVGQQACCLVASPLAQFVAVGVTTGHVYIVDINKVDEPRIVKRSHIHQGPVLQLHFNQNGHLLVSGSDDGHIFVMDGRPSKNFEPLGHTAIVGRIHAISSHQNDQSLETKIVVTTNTTEEARIGATRIFHFNLPDSVTSDPRSKHASLKCDFKDEALGRLAFNFTHPAFGIAVTEGNIAYTLCQNSRQLQKLILPSEPPKKEFSKDSYLKPAEECDCHQLAGGIVRLSPHQKWLATCGTDGRLSLRTVGALDRSVDVNAHDFRTGGVRSLAFTADACRMLTIGYDGTLTCYKWNFSSSAKEKSVVDAARTRQNILMKEGQGEDNTITGMEEWTHSGVSRPGSSTEKAEKEKSEKEQEIEKALENDVIYSTPTPVPGDDATWLQAKEIEAHKEEDKQYSNLKTDLREQIRDMRRKLQVMIKENDDVPEIERLGHHDFDLDTEEQSRLEAEGEAEVDRIREEKEFENLAKLYLTELIKAECWDNMVVKGRGIAAFNSTVEVANYPMKDRTRAEKDELSRVQTQRRLELDELKARQELVEKAAKKNTSSAIEEVMKIQEDIKEEEHVQIDDKQPDEEMNELDDVEDGRKEKPSTVGSLGAEFGGDSELFHSQFELHTREQKMNQIILIKDAIYRIKMHFNKEFDSVYGKKEQEISKIKDKNRRIRKIMEDLGLNEDVFEPELGVTEKPEMLLTVREDEDNKRSEEEEELPSIAPLDKPVVSYFRRNRIKTPQSDSELLEEHRKREELRIKVEKYLTPEQRKKQEELAKAEEERRLREKGDNWRERGLDMMMGGLLEIKKEDELKKDIPVPAFMAAKPEEEWSEDEKKLVQEYERKVKELQEEREKYRKQLEMELKKLQSLIQDGSQAFDEALYALFMKKIKTEMVVYQEELKIERLKYALLLEEELDNREKELQDLLHHKHQLKKLTIQAVDESKKNMDAYHEEYRNLEVEEKLLDKNFKKEFNDVPAVLSDQLYKLFRRRPRGQKARGSDTPLHDPNSGNPFADRPSTARKNDDQQKAVEASLAELDRDTNAPEGCEIEVWHRLCRYRREKVANEQMVKAKAQILADMEEFWKKRQAEAENLRSEIDELADSINKLKEDRLRFCCNLEVQLMLKQGQVEVDAGSYIHDYRGSLLIHRNVVEELNGKIRQLGESKISSMVESKDFRKGIIQLEWEHKKMTMEMEDYQNKIRNIQNLKVTREIQAFLNEEDHDGKKAQEIATLEQTIALMKQHHEKNVHEKKRVIKDLRKTIREKQEENDALNMELEDLNVSVNERRHIHEVNADKRSDAGQELRYKEIVQRRKLVDLAKAQAQEVAVLRAEVERLRMRTFPALVQVEH